MWWHCCCLEKATLYLSKTSQCSLAMRNHFLLFSVMFSVNPPDTTGYFSQLLWGHWLWDAGPTLPPADTFQICCPALTLHFISHKPPLKYKINNVSSFHIQPKVPVFFAWFMTKFLIITVNKFSVPKGHLVFHRSEWLWAEGTNKGRILKCTLDIYQHSWPCGEPRLITYTGGSHTSVSHKHHLWTVFTFNIRYVRILYSCLFIVSWPFAV